jgi:hypothetical protein
MNIKETLAAIFSGRGFLYKTDINSSSLTMKLFTILKQLSKPLVSLHLPYIYAGRINDPNVKKH